jgi:Fe-S-cluster containining protein
MARRSQSKGVADPMTARPLPLVGIPESCECPTCQGYCENKPGWFLPGEVEKAADFLGLPLQEFFDRFLSVDWWQGDPAIFLLSPAVVGAMPGEMFPADPHGQCVFYRDGKCDIHPVKPHECRAAWHGGNTGLHEATARGWDTPEAQAQVVELLGRQPVAREWNPWGFEECFP